MNGCAGRDCPCRLRVNCTNYIYSYRKYYKEINEAKQPDIKSYYEVYYKFEAKLIDVIGNG